MNKRLLAVSILSVCAGVGMATADVRIILRPWVPRAVVIVPPVVVPPPPVVRAIPADAGFVAFNVRPADTAAYVDGDYRGLASAYAAPADYMALVPGSHTIALVKEGFERETFVIQVQPRKTIELDVTLDQVTKDRPIPEKTYQLDLNETGTMILKVEPGDAAVYVDDSFFGNASQFSEYKGALVLRTGPHKVELSRPGFANYSTTVDITKDTVKEVHMTLKTLEVKP